MDFLRMLLVVSSLLCASAAHASLIFSFTFANDAAAGGNTDGPITGEVHFLADNGSQGAVKVIITGIGAHPQFGHVLPFDVIAGGWVVANNIFTVDAGSVTGWSFASRHDHLTSIVLELLELGTTGGGTPFFGVSVQGQPPQLTISSANPQFALLQQASAPAPSVLVLLGIGYVGLYFSRRRKPAATL